MYPYAEDIVVMWFVGFLVLILVGAAGYYVSKGNYGFALFVQIISMGVMILFFPSLFGLTAG